MSTYDFQNSHVPLKVWLQVIYHFSCDAQLYQIEKYVSEVSQKTLINMLSTLREACVVDIKKDQESLVFGGDVECRSDVEFDESAFGKKRYENKYNVQWMQLEIKMLC